MEKKPLVYAIVLSYNSERTLQKCLMSLLRSQYPNLEIVLVDNNSTDGSFEQAKSQFQKIHFIRNRRNIGFGPGNNIGIRFALEKFADYVFLLNADAYVEPNTISLLVEEAEKRSRNCILNPLIYTCDKESTWFEGSTILWSKMKALHAKTDCNDSVCKTAYATGCAMLVPQKIFAAIGLFDERFFLYYEDADFSVRAQKRGFSTLIVKSATTVHDETSEQNLSQKTYWLVLSGLHFFKKHTPILLRPWRLVYLAGRLAKNSFDSITHTSPITRAVRNAYYDYFFAKK